MLDAEDVIREGEGRKNKPYRLRLRLAWRLGAVNVIATLFFTSIVYNSSRQDIFQHIDDTLCASAEGVRSIVPPMIYEQAQNGRESLLYRNVYNEVQSALERYANSMKITYLYATIINPDDTTFELVGNLSTEQKASKLDAIDIVFMKPYIMPSTMRSIAKSGQRGVDTDSDEYGYTRSCYTPVTFGSGSTVIFGADMDVAEIDKLLKQKFAINTVIGLAFILVMIFTVRTIINGTIKDLQNAVDQANKISKLIFHDDKDRATSRTLEVDQLFSAMYFMHNGLKAFGKFVPVSVVRKVIGSGLAEIGGNRRELSFMMTDVANFTSISETIDAERVMVMMSDYFKRVVSPILQNHGTIDKYIGDAVLAFWNAPEMQESHALLCCSAALSACKESNDLANEWKAKGLVPWKTRFGLHTGYCIFGNVGAPDRMDFTAIGSAVNLTSRLEGLNKHYGTEILASQRVRELAQDSYVFRSIDVVRPQGVRIEFPIYELMGSRDDFSEDLSNEFSLWETAYSLYRESKWDDALPIFEQRLHLHPLDRVAALYVTRCRDLIAEPPSEPWNGVEIFDKK